MSKDRHHSSYFSAQVIRPIAGNSDVEETGGPEIPTCHGPLPFKILSMYDVEQLEDTKLGVEERASALVFLEALGSVLTHIEFFIFVDRLTCAYSEVSLMFWKPLLLPISLLLMQSTKSHDMLYPGSS